MNKPANLAVNRSCLAIDYKQCFIGWCDHVVTKHPRGCNGSVWCVPLSEGWMHGLAHPCDHLHFPCNETVRKSLVRKRRWGGGCCALPMRLEYTVKPTQQKSRSQLIIPTNKQATESHLPFSVSVLDLSPHVSGVLTHTFHKRLTTTLNLSTYTN